MLLAEMCRYNSAFYSSQMRTSYDIWVVSPHFFSPNANLTYSFEEATDQDFLVSTEQVRRDIMGNGTTKFERLDAVSCIKGYGQTFNHEYRSLVIVSKDTSNPPDPYARRSNGPVLYRTRYSTDEDGFMHAEAFTPFPW